MIVLIVYSCQKDRLRFRLVQSPRDLHESDITSMGWIVLSIQYYAKGRFYNEYHFRQLVLKQNMDRQAREKKKAKLRRIIQIFYDSFH